MTSKIEYLHYDEEVDHLTIYKADEKINKTINVGTALLSLNKKRELVGIELMGIHEKWGVPLGILTNISKCRVEIQYEKAQLFLRIILTQKPKKELSPILMPIGNLDLKRRPFTDTLVSVPA